jgi:heterodisulfide reductase subunit B
MKWPLRIMSTAEKKFLTKSEFTKLVVDTVKSHKSSHMDAIIHLCEVYDIELEDIRKYISPVIKTKLEAEAMKLNFLPQQNSLPI